MTAGGERSELHDAGPPQAKPAPVLVAPGPCGYCTTPRPPQAKPAPVVVAQDICGNCAIPHPRQAKRHFLG